MQIIFKFLVLSQVFIYSYALQNISCGCIQYDGNPAVRCYTPPTICATRYLGNSTYASSIQLQVVVTALFDNDFQLLNRITSAQNNISWLTSNLQNSMSNQNSGNSANSWIMTYYRDLLIGLLFLLLAIQTAWICKRDNRIHQQMPRDRTQDQLIDSKLKKTRRKKAPKVEEMNSTCEISIALQNSQNAFAEPK